MKRTLLIILTVILLLSILVLVPSEVTLAEVVPIPVDQTKMDPVQDKYYLSETEYQDPSLNITMERGTWTAPFRSEKNNYGDHHQGDTVTTNYWVIRIQVADASQLRTGVSRARERDKWCCALYRPRTGNPYRLLLRWSASLSRSGRSARRSAGSRSRTAG